MAAFRVGILGMGRISAGFDEADDPLIRTHVKAVLAEPRLALVYVADNDSARAEAECRRFGVKAEIVTPEAICGAALDVLCIATPDNTHVDLVGRAAAGKARVVLVEKPLDGDRELRIGVRKAVESRNGVLVVHHLRRWIPSLASWIDAARSGAYGRPLSATVHYTRGLEHNGIHALDLVAAFFQPGVSSVTEIAEPALDFAPHDPTRSLLVELTTAAGPVPFVMFGTDGRTQTIFSVDLRFERGRIVVRDEDGIRAALHRPVDVEFPGFAHELRPVTQFHDKPSRLLAEVWRNIADHLECGAPIVCAGTEAVAAYDLADSILAKLSESRLSV